MIVLFVCWANLNRSPRAEEVFKELCKEFNLDIKVISAGIEAPEGANPEELKRKFGVTSCRRLTKELIDESDIIFVMEHYMKQIIISSFGVPSKKIKKLEIPDIYNIRANNLDELYKILNEKLRPYAQKLAVKGG